MGEIILTVVANAVVTGVLSRFFRLGAKKLPQLVNSEEVREVPVWHFSRRNGLDK